MVYWCFKLQSKAKKMMKIHIYIKKGCTARESNPGRKNGNLAWYHYTSGADTQILVLKLTMYIAWWMAIKNCVVRILLSVPMLTTEMVKCVLVCKRLRAPVTFKDVFKCPIDPVIRLFCNIGKINICFWNVWHVSYNKTSCIYESNAPITKRIHQTQYPTKPISTHNVKYSSMAHFKTGFRRSPQKLHSRPYFMPPVRGIGYSFQLAITTPRIDLIGYGTATAQRCPACVPLHYNKPNTEHF